MREYRKSSGRIFTYMNRNKSSISICILSYNRCDLLRSLLEELLLLRFKPLRDNVVDNHSEDGTKRVVRQEFSGVVYIRTDRNIGAAQGI